MATYYSSHSAAGGGVGSIADPFTIQELFNAVTTAHLGLIMATGTYTPSAKLDLNTNTGSTTAPVNLRGCASDGTDDGTVATISGSSLPGSTTLLQIANGIDYLRLSNIRLTASKNYGLDSNSNGTILTNVRIDNAASHGIYQQTISDVMYLCDCEVDHNGGGGYSGPFTSRGSGVWVQCSIHDNTSFGARLAAYGSMRQCRVYANGGAGVIWDFNSSGIGEITHCTIAGNSGAGVDFISGTTTKGLISYTILKGNTSYGIDLNGTDIDTLILSRLCSYGNLGDIDTGSLPSDTVTSDPGFANESSGTQDYTPSNTALRIARTAASGIGGTDYTWIGAVNPQGSGGGSARPSHPLLAPQVIG